ncbi:MAG: lipase maturation factor family protein [Candidatus Acidiferrales bacterium]
MKWNPSSALRWLLDSERGPSNRLLPRWIFLRALGLIYFSAFFSLAFQIRGLIGPNGILPAGEYLQAVARVMGPSRIWFAPTLLWFSSTSQMLVFLCWAGMAASLLVVLNLWPRATLALCFVFFLSFVCAARDFSGYQSDGMLLEAGFISLFFAPPGFRPGLGAAGPPSRISLFVLQWEWFRIYFESGVAKIASGDIQWRHLTAMDEYYQNGPLPTWIGWYAQHLPHWFHAASAGATLCIELGLVWLMFLPRRWRIVCFLIVTPFEVGIILTANYTFLNYLVLVLGFLLLDDEFLSPFVPNRWRSSISPRSNNRQPPEKLTQSSWRDTLRPHWKALRLSVAGVLLGCVFYSTAAQLLWMFSPSLKLPVSPVEVLEPFRIANRYGLFAYMTRARYEIEFQGSNDGDTWVAYPFRFKPQDVSTPPGIYAPYQPRFDWNLWFASLGPWNDSSIVPRTEEHLLSNDSDVLALFAGNPFPSAPPRQVRAVLWQYRFSTLEERLSQRIWWRRELLGLYAPAIERLPDGRINVLEWPAPLAIQQ